MKFNPTKYLKNLPLPANEKWKDGVWDIEVFKHGTMLLEIFAPEGKDYQTSHDQDEIYFIIDGSGKFEIEGKLLEFSPGDVLFVPAGKQHRFLEPLMGVKTWAIFYGPKGGETNN